MPQVHVPKKNRLPWIVGGVVVVATVGVVTVMALTTEVFVSPAKIYDQALEMKYSKDPAGAADLLTKAIAQHPQRTDQAFLKVRLGALYESQKHCDLALKTYQEVEALNLKPEMPEVVGMARCSEKLGDNAAALKYYHKTYDLVDRSVMGHEADLKFYEQKIRTLGGSI
jgi:tetratricopeptide (TPR) repeat protein